MRAKVILRLVLMRMVLFWQVSTEVTRVFTAEDGEGTLYWRRYELDTLNNSNDLYTLVFEKH